jgi:hypothetical protein
VKLGVFRRESKEEQRETYKTDLLKNSYRIDQKPKQKYEILTLPKINWASSFQLQLSIANY